MFYTVYKVTNKMNGKVYIGCHKTTNLDDGYMGSGKYLKRGINKHGLENFEKEILFVFDNHEEMFAKEAELVNEDFIAEENTYNLKVGGMGGWDHINSTESKEHCSKGGHATAKLLKENPTLKLQVTEKISNYSKKQWNDKSFRAKMLEVNTGRTPTIGFTGKTHTTEARQKISKRNIGSQNGSYGKVWYYNPETLENIKCLPEEKPLGYVRGRKMQSYRSCVSCGKDVISKSRKKKYCDSCEKEVRSKNGTKNIAKAITGKTKYTDCEIRKEIEKCDGNIYTAMKNFEYKRGSNVDKRFKKIAGA